jgi:soluble lytic murein transglycosylase-like protein
MFLIAFSLGWCVGNAIWPLEPKRAAIAIDAITERIIRVESNGDPNARSKRSTAMGLAQFLDATWLELIRTHRPDLAQGIDQDKALELRRDANLTREMAIRFTQQNAEILRKRGLPVTPGTLYLAHFAGGAGAVAILSASEGADAASVMANADPTGRTKREKIVKANPFLGRFTIADLKSWADRRMGVPPG